MKTVGRIAFTAAALAAAFVAGAQERQALTLDDAIAATLADNPAMKAAAHEERAAQQERRAAIGLRMPQIGITGAYTYLGKDIGFDFNGLKAPVKDVANRLLGSGIITDPALIGSIQGLLNPMLNADWFLTLQDRSLGFVGGEVTVPIWLGGKINAANRAAKINEQTAVEAGNQTRNALVSQLVERYFGPRAGDAGRGGAAAGRGGRTPPSGGCRRIGAERYDRPQRAALRRVQDGRGRARTGGCRAAGGHDHERTGQHAGPRGRLSARHGDVHTRCRGGARLLPAARRAAQPAAWAGGAQAASGREGVRVQRADFMPQVVAMGGGSFYNYQVSGIVPRWAVGVGVRFKLFDGLNREYKYSAARQTVQRVGELRNKAEQDISVLVEQLYNQMMNYRNRMASIDASLDFAEEYLRIKNAAFLEGMSSSSDLIDAELNLAGVRIERLQAAYNFDKLLAQLLEAAGVSDEYTAYARRADARPVRFDGR